MARYRAFLRTDRKREFRTASDYYCAFLPYISPEESKQLSAGHCNLFPYPRYPWEKKGSYGSCTGAMNKDAWLHAPRTLRVAGLSNRPRLKYSIMIVLQLVHPLRARCFARCCTTPVLADELEYREKPFFLLLGYRQRRSMCAYIRCIIVMGNCLTHYGIGFYDRISGSDTGSWGWLLLR